MQTQEAPRGIPMDDEEINRRVGARFRLARQHAAMSQERVAALLGCTFQQVQKCEKGVNRLGPEKLARFAVAAGVSIEWLFAGVMADQEAGTIPAMVAELAADRRFGELGRLWAELPDTYRDGLLRTGKMFAGLVEDQRRAA